MKRPLISRTTLQLGLVLTVVLAATVASARVAVPDILSDGMVLQRDAKVPVWGTADPGEVVTVRFAGHIKKTTAGADGRWRVDLPPLHANANPATLTISGTNKLEIK